MNAGMLESLIPITAILATFGFPVAMVFVFKWFKLRDRELQLDIDMRKDLSVSLEARMQRVESILLQLEPHLHSRLDLMQGPPELRASEQPGDPLPLLRKDRSG
jgi:hypothetical protein